MTDTRESLPVFVLYDHPADHPDYFIVRVHRALRDGTVRADDDCCGFHELDTARAWLAQQGLTCIGRYPQDEPHIIEAWI